MARPQWSVAVPVAGVRNYSTVFMQDFPASAAITIIRLALEEDLGSGDLTCQLVLPPGHRSRARIVAKDRKARQPPGAGNASEQMSK